MPDCLKMCTHEETKINANVLLHAPDASSLLGASTMAGLQPPQASERPLELLALQAHVHSERAKGSEPNHSFFAK